MLVFAMGESLVSIHRKCLFWRRLYGMENGYSRSL